MLRVLGSCGNMAAGLLVIFWQMDGRSTDSVASLIVSFTILCGVGVGVMAWSKPHGQKEGRQSFNDVETQQGN